MAGGVEAGGRAKGTRRHRAGAAGTPENGLTRRKFLQFGGLAACSVLLPASGLLSGCSADDVSNTLSNLGVKSTLDATLRGTREFTDDYGRTRTIPTVDKLERVYFTSALAQIYVFSLRPDLMGGTGIQFSKQELSYLPDWMPSLAYMGSLSGGGEIDREAIMAAGIQLIIDCSARPITASDVSQAQGIEDQTGIPALCIDGSFDKAPAAYQKLGEILGAEDRAKDIGSYLNGIYEDVTAAVADVPDSERVKLYYAEGPLGLQTEPDRGLHALTFDVAGANNVAAIEETQGIGMTNVSLETVMAWNPDVIIAWDDVIRGGADEIIRTDSKWSHVKAVQDGRVYTMPNAPFAWCDRPPGVNRFLGVQWIANMCYPDRYDVDMVEETKKFYSKLYWIDITDDQAKSLLGNSYPPYGKQG